jgi:cysteine synthase
LSNRYKNILGTIGNTPIVQLSKLAPAGVNLYAKVESFNPLSSVKDRLALGVIEAAEKSGALKPGQTVVEPPAAIPALVLRWFARRRVTPWLLQWPIVLV